MAVRKTKLRTRFNRWRRSAAGQKLTHAFPAFVIFAVAAWQSYWHSVKVTEDAGEDASKYIMAFSIDGLMIVASRYITHAKTPLGRGIALLGFVAGTAATFAVNILAADPNPLSRTVAGWPAFAMVMAASMIHWGERKPKARPRAARSQTEAPGKLRSVA